MFFIIRDPEIDSEELEKCGRSPRRRSASEPGAAEREASPMGERREADLLMAESPPFSSSPESSLESLVIKITKAEHQKLHIVAFL